MTALRAIEQYDDTQDSGIEWLGRIPAHWQLKKLKFVVDIAKRIAGKEGFDVLSITQKGIKVKDVESGEGQLAMDYSKYQFLYKGEFAMNHMDLLTGYVDISQYDGVVSPDYRVFKNRSSEVLDAYLLLIFQMGYTQRIFYKYGQGVSSLGRWRFPADNFNNFLIPIPPLEEQSRIINFVSSKSGQIDEAISIKERQIALLVESKKIIIHKAVTQGIDANVKMKDSGVDWLGFVPEHWFVKKIKFHCRIKNGVDYKHVEVEDGYPVYGSGGQFTYASSYLHDGEAVLLGRKGTIDKPLYVNEKFWTVDTMFYCLCDKNVVAKYIYYCATTIPFSFYSTATALPSMTQSDLLNHFFALPDKNEQKRIVNYLEVELSHIEEGIEAQSEQIKRLKEYKETMINNAVTGRIKVA